MNQWTGFVRVKLKQAKSVFLKKVEKRQAKSVFLLKVWECQFLSVEMLEKIFVIKNLWIFLRLNLSLLFLFISLVIKDKIS